MRRIFIILFICSLIFNFKVIAQNISNEGTDFWAVFPTHIASGNSLATMSVIISAKSNSSGKIVVGGTTLIFNVIANKTTKIDIPRPLAYIDYLDAEKVVNKGVHIIVDKDQPKVSVYVHIYARARSEAYLVLPVPALGKKYYAMTEVGMEAPSTAPQLTGRPFLVVLAVEDNTTVNISSNITNYNEKVTLPKAGDVYEILNSGDLTGYKIEIDNANSSCKTFAVYSGHSGVAFEGISYDPLAQQLYPVNSWGRLYGVVPFFERDYFCKILASEDNTSIKINGVKVGIINEGESYLIQRSTDFALIESDKPTSVAQFTYSQSNISSNSLTTIGDPEMVILNPIEYSIKNITVFSSSLEAITEKYINVFIKTNAINSFKINGASPKSSWNTVITNPTYSYLQEKVKNQSLTLTANDNFNAVAYGFGSAESYAYSAGTNLATTQFLKLKNRVTNLETTAACLGQASDFKVTLPYVLTKIKWYSENGDLLYDDPNPEAIKSNVNGQDLYTYFAPVNVTFNTITKVKFTAIATVAKTADNCFDGDLNLNFEIDVDPLPTAKFINPPEGCFGQEILFTSQSLSNLENKSITKWFWDFGDGTTSNEENPTHAFAKSGNNIVKLFVGAESGCMSEVSEGNINISDAIDSKFIANKNGCANSVINFKDQSANSKRDIVKWLWDMGDGVGKFENSSNIDVNYVYANAGKYNVILTTINDKGCSSKPFTAEITITALPKSIFLTPKICIDDPQAIFINNSLDHDGTINNLTYLWDFGDPTSGILNTSTEKEGKHKYKNTGEYIVTLTVTNSLNCTSIPTQSKIQVNSATAIASFEVMNKSDLCSNQIFSLKNTSTVIGYGNIIKLEWYFDGILEQRDDNPSFDKIYNFEQPEFASPEVKKINVTLKVFTGEVGSCTNTSSPTEITLKSSPVVTFDALTSICLNNQPIQLRASASADFKGLGIFSGRGINEGGIFNPINAGIGTHEITYTYIGDNGCSDSKMQTIEVLSIPLVNAGSDEYILLGGEKKLEATAKGTGLTYKWTPSIGLNRDDILNPIASPEKDILYTLNVSSKNGCANVDQVYVYVLDNVNAPNSFTPNGDGINDVWNIPYLNTFPKVTVEIFNRNGQSVFFSRGYTAPFDGNYKAKPLPIGTYYYIISPNSRRKSITGNVTILR